MLIEKVDFEDWVARLQALDKSQLVGLISRLGPCQTRVMANGDVKLSIRVPKAELGKKTSRRPRRVSRTYRHVHP